MDNWYAASSYPVCTSCVLIVCCARFEVAHSRHFYSTKLKVVADATEEQGPRYALYRSLVGPAILSTW